MEEWLLRATYSAIFSDISWILFYGTWLLYYQLFIERMEYPMNQWWFSNAIFILILVTSCDVIIWYYVKLKYLNLEAEIITFIILPRFPLLVSQNLVRIFFYFKTILKCYVMRLGPSETARENAPKLLCFLLKSFLYANFNKVSWPWNYTL